MVTGLEEALVGVNKLPLIWMSVAYTLARALAVERRTPATHNRLRNVFILILTQAVGQTLPFAALTLAAKEPKPSTGSFAKSTGMSKSFDTHPSSFLQHPSMRSLPGV